jgi:hypothetical protein
MPATLKVTPPPPVISFPDFGFEIGPMKTEPGYNSESKAGKLPSRPDQFQEPEAPAHRMKTWAGAGVTASASAEGGADFRFGGMRGGLAGAESTGQRARVGWWRRGRTFEKREMSNLNGAEGERRRVDSARLFLQYSLLVPNRYVVLQVRACFSLSTMRQNLSEYSGENGGKP